MAKLKALILAGGALLALTRCRRRRRSAAARAGARAAGAARRGRIQRLVSARRRRPRRQRQRAEHRPNAGSDCERRCRATSSERRRDGSHNTSISASGMLISASAIRSTIGSASTSPANTAADRTSSRCSWSTHPANVGTVNPTQLVGLLSRRLFVDGRPGQRLRRHGHLVWRHALCRRGRRRRPEHACPASPTRPGLLYRRGRRYHDGAGGRLRRRSIQVEFRLGADGRHRFQRDAEPQARARLSLSRSRQVRLGQAELPERNRRRRRLRLHRIRRSSRRTMSPSTTSASACAG